MVVTTYDGDQEEIVMASLTQNMGIGYKLNDTWTVGL
jgi:hypothetical protein